MLIHGNLKSAFLILAWSLYDLANQFFVLNVVSLYFVRWLTIEQGAPEIFYSIAFGISMFFTAILAPLLGSASDLTARRRPFLIFFTLISVIFTMLLGISGNIFFGLLFFAIANFGCQTAIVFYNAQMATVAPKKRIGLVSGFGRMMGYSGAVLALYLLEPVVLKKGYQAAFIPTGILFLFFSLPCMLFVKDRQPTRYLNLRSFLKKERALEIFKSLKATAFDKDRFPGLLDFLKAGFFGLCAVNIIILFMSVYATRIFGFNETQVVHLVGFSTIFAIAGSIFSGFISDRIGYKRSLCIVFILWGICFVAGSLARNTFLYWAIGAVVGVALGSTWVVSRALAIKLVPEEQAGEVFGLFNLTAYLSAIVGAFFWGIILLFLSPLGEAGYRIALLTLIIFMGLGFIFLLRLPAEGPRLRREASRPAHR